MQQTFALARRGLRWGLQGLRREGGWGLALAALAALLAAAQILLAALAMIAWMERSFLEDAPLRVELRADAGERERQELLGFLLKRPEADRVTYVTREQVMQRERDRDAPYADLLARFSQARNPFRDAVEIVPRSAAGEARLLYVLHSEEWMNAVDASSLSRLQEQRRPVHAARLWLGAFRSGVWLLLSLLIPALACTLAVAARERARERKEELLVSRLTGARDSLLYLPFATEGFLLLFLAWVVSLVILFLLLTVAPLLPGFAVAGLFLAFPPGEFLTPYAVALLLLELLLFPLIAWVGAWMGVRSVAK